MITRIVSRAAVAAAASRRAAAAMVATALAVAITLPVSAQNAGQLWAAQTGLDQVSLSWDPVPGAVEYRIHLGDPNAPGTFLRQPTSRLGANSHAGRLTGVQRAAAGILLVAVDAGGQVLHQAQFNRIAPVTAFAPPTAPAGVSATATGANEVTVAWDPVPGATAYFIGRAVHRSGLGILCSLCSTQPFYVDRTAMTGLSHTYTVSAIFPSGDVSTRVVSNNVTPGAVQTAGAPTNTVLGKPMASGTPVPGTAANNTNVGASAGTTTGTIAPGSLPTTTTPTYTPPGQPAGAPPTTATPTLPTTASPADTTTIGRIRDWLVAAANNVFGGMSSVDTAAIRQAGAYLAAAASNLTSATQIVGTTHAASPIGSTSTTTSTTTATSTNPIGSALGGITGAMGNILSGGVAAPVSVTATAVGPGAASVAWQPSPTAGVTGYMVQRSVDGSAFEVLNTVAATTQSYSDAFFPATRYPAGSSVRVKYSVAAMAPGGSRGAAANEVVVQIPANAATPAPGGGSPASCRLDYQRADNMWAAWGRADGQLGTESISLPAGASKVFITDWKYEKQRNDGTNFFGSHLRIATNPTSQMIRLHLRSLVMNGLAIFSKTGNDTFWIRLDPNTTKQLQADLMEVFCEQ